MTTSHTPGPWVVRHNGYSQEVGEPSSKLPVAVIIDRARSDANAKLIAAAPDLLAACKEALDCAVRPGGDIQARHAKVTGMLTDAINKAVY